jgi:hypothetical protein
MGNRAVITTNQNLDETGIYLHWNGGRDSVEAFLAYCNLKGYRTPNYDSYGWAYLAGVITNFFGDGHSCGVNIAHNLDCDNYDNGVFIIKDWLIVGRKYLRGGEQLEYDLKETLEAIDKHQPKHMQLTPEEWEKFDDVKAEVLKARENTLICCK